MYESESIPQIVNDIIIGNLPALDNHFKHGWDIEKEIGISLYAAHSPLGFSLMMESFPSVQWLVEHGVDLNTKDNPSFLLAVRYCNETIIRYIVKHGAKVHGRNNVKSEAFEEALYGEKYHNLQLIHELGHSVEKYGGGAFRKAVSDRNYDVLRFFLAHEVDVNYNKPDMVYPFCPTPLCVAARYVDLAMCKFLVQHGADVTIGEKDGMRPYNIAVEKSDREMAEYFKMIEPAEFHNMQNKLLELRKYKLPKALSEFLQSDQLKLDLAGNGYSEYIEFFSLVDTVPMKIGRQKLLRLSKEVGNYSALYIVWNPKSKCIAYYDVEHEELCNIATFDEFFKDAAGYMEKIITGEIYP